MASNYFAVLAPQITGYVINQVQQRLPGARPVGSKPVHDQLVDWFINLIQSGHFSFAWLVALCSITILLLAVIRGIFMFFMRQTIIVMSRHIEFDQKNEIFDHYQKLDTNFYKTHSTGDMMNRMTEDVSRVRMFTGPAIMYLINLVSLIGFCVWNMLRKDVHLTILVLAPLPILAITIYLVNSIINKKSEKIQALLSDLTTNAQESFSGIRVIKSFVQEKAMFGFFQKNSEESYAYDVNIALSKDGGQHWSKPIVPHRDHTQRQHGRREVLPVEAQRQSAAADSFQYNLRACADGNRFQPARRFLCAVIMRNGDDRKIFLAPAQHNIFTAFDDRT